MQAQRQDAEIQRLTAALAAAPREDPNAPSTRQALQKMAAEVSWLAACSLRDSNL
jgi:hypothetical protein